MNHISQISIDEQALIRGDHNKRERDLVIADLLEFSSLSPVDSRIKGPFSLNVSIVNNKILMNVVGACGKSELVENSIMPLRRIIKDYSIICASYFDTVINADPRKVEAIDMGRRGAHNEGAEILREQISGQIEVDFETARKLFALIYFLQEK